MSAGRVWAELGRRAMTTLLHVSRVQTDRLEDERLPGSEQLVGRRLEAGSAVGWNQNQTC